MQSSEVINYIDSIFLAQDTPSSALFDQYTQPSQSIPSVAIFRKILSQVACS